MQFFLQIIKFIATILITNSHYDTIYPIKALATGGSIGNSLFFFISGYCLYNIKGSGFGWFKKRIIRIYPTVLIGSIITLLLSTQYNLNSVIDYIKYFIYPTSFWFISAILVFYVIYYFIIKTKLKQYIPHIILFLSFIYLYIYVFYLDNTIWIIEGINGEGYFRWIFYFQIMLFGAYMKSKMPLNNTRRNYLFYLILSLVAYFGFKVLMDRYTILMRLQLIIHILTFPIVYFIFRVLYKYEEKIKLNSKSYWFRIVNFIGDLTLEIYIIQFLIIWKFNKLIFPINFAVVTIIILASAYIIKICSQYIQKILETKIDRSNLGDIIENNKSTK